MKYKDLIDAGKAHLEKYPGHSPVSKLVTTFPVGARSTPITMFPRGVKFTPLTMFPMGARWMHDRLNELDGNNRHPFDANINYNLYGYLNYSICLAGTCLAAWWLAGYEPLLTPLSIIIFYLLEIQFLFLFPLLIDQSDRPVITAIRATFKIGMFKCLFTVIPIAVYMMTGLFRKKNMLHNWYVGCLSILIWYNNEVRDRISPSL